MASIMTDYLADALAREVPLYYSNHELLGALKSLSLRRSGEDLSIRRSFSGPSCGEGFLQFSCQEGGLTELLSRASKKVP